MIKKLKKDISAVFERDPAARNVLEVLFCYPGLHALLLYRLSHWFWNRHLRLVGRIISHIGRFFTGIEIHPGAKIGRGFFIDHGMGVVIGETSEIGENVTLYQGVTLGGTSHKKEKRHPTIEDNVIIGAHATILGPLTIGANSRVGAGSVVIKNVPPCSTVVGVPGRVVVKDGVKVTSDEKKPLTERDDLDHDRLPDPVVNAVQCLTERVVDLEKEIAKLKEKSGAHPESSSR